MSLSNLKQDCAICGLRFGSCHHTSMASVAVMLLERLTSALTQEHAMTHTAEGARCRSCNAQSGMCPTLEIIRRTLQ